MKDIVDTAVAAGSFKTLATALQAAGLVDVLKGKGPFTVFAPTDEAFAKLPAGTLEALLKDPKALAEVLKYHVVSGAVKVAAPEELRMMFSVLKNAGVVPEEIDLLGEVLQRLVHPHGKRK